MSEGQRAYEARRAARAGMSLDRWLDAKRREAEAKAAAAAKEAKAKAAPKPAKAPGLFSRLMERAQRPLR